MKWKHGEPQCASVQGQGKLCSKEFAWLPTRLTDGYTVFLRHYWVLKTYNNSEWAEVAATTEHPGKYDNNICPSCAREVGYCGQC
jgi:hypothetical protein